MEIEIAVSVIFFIEFCLDGNILKCLKKDLKDIFNSLKNCRK